MTIVIVSYNDEIDRVYHAFEKWMIINILDSFWEDNVLPNGYYSDLALSENGSHDRK